MGKTIAILSLSSQQCSSSLSSPVSLNRCFIRAFNILHVSCGCHFSCRISISFSALAFSCLKICTSLPIGSYSAVDLPASITAGSANTFPLRSPHTSRAFAWSGDAKKLSSNDSFEGNVAKYSKLGQMSAFFCISWVGLGTL
jgi:hypothetical protein